MIKLKYIKFPFLNEMGNYNSDITGIKNIVIWLGFRPKTHGHRIKVSNEYNIMNKNNCFTITIPLYQIKGECKLSKKDILDIKTFIKLNEQLIMDYSDLKITTTYLLENITKI